jgi:hypothetical protein
MHQRLDQFARAPVLRQAQLVGGFSGAVVGREENDGLESLGRAVRFGKRRQVFKQDVRVGYDGVHDSRPCMRSLV